MWRLILRMLLRKRGTAVAVLAIALLIALVASVDSLLNNVTAQTTALTQLAHISETYLVVSKNVNVLSESQIDPLIINQLRNNPNIGYAVSQQITSATVNVDSTSYSVTVRGIDELPVFLQRNRAIINGSVSEQPLEVNIGVILSNLLGAKINDTLPVTISGQSINLKVVGIIETSKQADTELLMPLDSLEMLTHNTSVSYVEFSLKNQNQADLNNITQTLPSNTKLMQTQKLVTFAQDINDQTVVFITCWSTTIYAVVIATSYVLASRIVNEAEYELLTLHNLGAKKNVITRLILMYTLIVAFVGSAVGVALGIVGTQIAATGIRWLWGNALLAPFLEPFQALLILLPALVAALIGGLYPILTATKTVAREMPL
jgi:ABC-type lipoprotein release transport system permease subunit